MNNFKLQAFIASVDQYNEGHLVGEWVSFPTTPEEISAALERVGVNDPDSLSVPSSDFFIADFATDLPGDIDQYSQFDSLEELNYLAGRLEEMDTAEFDHFRSIVQNRTPIPESLLI